MKIIYFPLLLILTVICGSCGSKDEPVPTQISDRMILIYMAANNSLGGAGADNKDLIEIKEAVISGALGKNNRLMLFYSSRENTQSLYEFMRDGSMQLVKAYPGTDYATSSNFMLGVFNDAKGYAPARDYGLILWSHALGWTENGQIDDGPTITPKTWGDDRGHAMNITTLKRVIEASPWSWIYFDCCFMGSVEVAYELAPVVNRIVASASEVPLDGMPYEKNLPLLFAPEADLVGAARNTYEYYDDEIGVNRTATICVLDLSHMSELGRATADIYKQAQKVSPKDFYNMPLEITNVVKFYDYGIYVDGLCKVNDIDLTFSESWQAAHDATVVYHAATPKLWNQISLDGFTGMSTFIPQPGTTADETYRNYNTLSWYKDVARYLFNKSPED